jgi:arsenate reductase
MSQPVNARRASTAPAGTVGRAFTDTFAGIAPTSVPAFVASQLVGAVAGTLAIAVFHPRPGSVTDNTAIDPADPYPKGAPS